MLKPFNRICNSTINPVNLDTKEIAIHPLQKILSGKYQTALICGCLIILILSVYAKVITYDFIVFDDDLYITDNEHVKKGFTSQSVKWALSTPSPYWHPLTWLSHMTDCELFGLNPGGHHATSIFIHILNTLLLFIVFLKMTGDKWKSAFLSAVFALHPINVDSVAWIAERKNVLSTLFGFLTMLCYTLYVKKPKIKSYLVTVFVFALSLMAKPMLVTLPFLFLLLDYWPLNRVQFLSEKENPKEQTISVKRFIRLNKKLIIEKLPLFILAFISVGISSYAISYQKSGVPLEDVPMALRIENAAVSYVKYIYKMIWPQDLAIYYPFPQSIPTWKSATAALLLFAITLYICVRIKKNPWLFTGWFWYIGTLFPVIGIKQTGLWPAISDRWGYVPLIGLYVIISWGIPSLVHSWKFKKQFLKISAALTILLLLISSYLQTLHWKDTIVLFKHSMKVTGFNDRACNNIGVAYVQKNKNEEALFYFKKALELNPLYKDAHFNYANALSKEGKIEASIWHFKKTLKIDPEHLEAHNDLGIVLANTGKLDEAISHFKKAVQINPNDQDAAQNLNYAIELKKKAQRNF